MCVRAHELVSPHFRHLNVCTDNVLLLLADEGISRMQTSLRRRHRDRVVRRGIGMTIESECVLCLSTHDLVHCGHSTDV